MYKRQEQYLGPRYENVPGVEYILENGTLLYFMEEAPGVYESADHTVTGAADKPKLYVPVYDGDELQPSSFEEVGAREQLAAITDFTVTMGLPGVNQRQEPGFVLDNGLVLLESERDSQGNYKACLLYTSPPAYLFCAGRAGGCAHLLSDP